MGGGHAWPSLLIGSSLPPPRPLVAPQLPLLLCPPLRRQTKDSSPKQTSAPRRRVTRSQRSGGAANNYLTEECERVSE